MLVGQYPDKGEQDTTDTETLLDIFSVVDCMSAGHRPATLQPSIDHVDKTIMVDPITGFAIIAGATALTAIFGGNNRNEERRLELVREEQQRKENERQQHERQQQERQLQLRQDEEQSRRMEVSLQVARLTVTREQQQQSYQLQVQQQQQAHQLQLKQHEEETKRMEIAAEVEEKRIQATREKQREDAELKKQEAELEEKRIQAARDKEREDAELKKDKVRMRKEARERRDQLNALALEKLGNNEEKVMELMKMVHDQIMAEYKSDEEMD